MMGATVEFCQKPFECQEKDKSREVPPEPVTQHTKHETPDARVCA